MNTKLAILALAGLLVPAAFGQFQYQRLKLFGATATSPGTYFAGKMIEAKDGKLYGMTGNGGSNDLGTVFRLNKDGTGYALLHRFSGPDGAHPGGTEDYYGYWWAAALLEGADGALYGTTRDGGSKDLGTVFKLSKDGSSYVVLHNFAGSDADGGYPQEGLVEGSDGGLYGTTHSGGSNGSGTVFRLNKDGSGYSILHMFSASDFEQTKTGHESESAGPNWRLSEGSDGALYGTVFAGASCCRWQAIFKMNKDGSQFGVLDYFQYGDLAGGILSGSNGALYGTTGRDPTNQFGTVFRLNTDGSGYTVLHSFGETDGDGQYPAAGLIEGSDGALYGTTSGGGAEGLGTLFKLNKDGTSYTVLFSSSTEQGLGELTEGTDGALYGSVLRGPNDDPLPPRPVVFKLSKDGSGYTFLYAFSRSADGVRPVGLTEGRDRALYGTTRFGGSNDLGTVFKVERDASGYKVLHHFATNGDGRYPWAALVEGSDGALYGTTDDYGSTNLGTVFRLNKDGYSVLHRFTGVDGRPWRGLYLIAPLIEGSDGALYGTTHAGGITNTTYPYNGGTVFKLNKDGSDYRVLHSFDFWVGDGALPGGPLLQGSDGALYGTTAFGPVTNATYNHGAGTIFKLNKDGSGYSILLSFTGTGGDGAVPIALEEGSKGALYGTTLIGGKTNATYSVGVGTIFRLNKDGGGYEVLHSFNEGVDGAWPSSLVKGSDGAFYGNTEFYNASYPYVGGTIFRLNRDGTGYTVVQAFPTSLVSSSYFNLDLALASSDGTLYMVQQYGGERGLGALFAFRPQPLMLPPIVSGGEVLVRFTSMPGSAHQLQRASALNGSWLTLTDVIVPTNGVAQFDDLTAPQPYAFYRTIAP